jgi:hypothetical protein
MGRPELKIELTATEPVKAGEPEHASGWGDDAQSIEVTGKVAEIKVTKDGKSQFGLRIQDDGSLVLTDYGNMLFQLDAGSNLWLTPYRPWEEK